MDWQGDRRQVDSEVRQPLVPPPGTSPIVRGAAPAYIDASEKSSSVNAPGGAPGEHHSQPAASGPGRGHLRFHSEIFERRERMATGMPENLEEQLRLAEGTQQKGCSRWVLSRRAKFAITGAASIVAAVGLALIIYFVARSKPAAAQDNPYVASCSVFCHGELLQTVQTARLWNDSKTFVDMPLTVDPQDVLAAFHATFPDGGAAATRDQLSAFVSQYFLTAGSDTEPWVPDDYTPMPPMLGSVGNASLQEFALGINDLWLQLGRRIKDGVRDYPQRYTLVWQPYPMIVPGGRFLESYYWDSWWVVAGLLRCGMVRTATGVVLNLVHMLDTFGFVPNGGRVYYALPGRSQPPLLSGMVREIFEATGNTTFLAQVYPSLVREYAWWMQQGEYGHTVAINATVPSAQASWARRAADAAASVQQGGQEAAAVSVSGTVTKTYLLNRYVTTQLIPRPESWLEDVHTAAEAGFNMTAPGAQILYSELAAAAETGWDFSARWFADAENITTCDTSRVIPVELNAILYQVEANLAYFASVLSVTSSDVCAGAEAAATAQLNAAIGGQPAPAATQGGGGDSGARSHFSGSHSDYSACFVLQTHQACSAAPAAPGAADTSSGADGAAPANGQTAWAECALRAASALSGDAAVYKDAMTARAEAIEALLWDEERGHWTDLRIEDAASAPQTPKGRALASRETLTGAAPLPTLAATGGAADHSGNMRDRTAVTAAPRSFQAEAEANMQVADAASGVDVHSSVKLYFTSSSSALTLGQNVVRANLSSVSNYAPLWTQAYDASNITRVRSVLQSLQTSDLIQPAGLTSTMANSTQQWDFPNGWAPLQHMIIVGLNSTGVPEAVSTARELARRWVLSNYVAYLESGMMNEKYDTLGIGMTGGGGEYVPQVGFGWTNGVALYLITAYNFTTLDG